MGLGSERDVTLIAARAKAADARRQLGEGVDPIAAREGRRAQERLQKAGTITFAECAKKYIAAHRAGWRNPKHAAQWQSTLDTYAGPVLGQLAAQDVDTALVLRVLEPIWSRKPETGYDPKRTLLTGAWRPDADSVCAAQPSSSEGK
jgi:hypothetical protein